MKKFIPLAVAAAMALTAIPSFAAQTDVYVEPGVTREAGAATAEQAIAMAKATFDIPAELSQCNYEVYDRSGGQVFDITWSDAEYEKSVNVEINTRLVPVRYNDFTVEEGSGLSEIRKSQLLETAKAFLEKTVPQLAGSLVYSEDDSGGIRFRFNRYENGIRVEGSYANVTMSRTTGRVRGYSLVWDFDGDFSATGGIEAEKAYQALNDVAVRTEYQIFGEKAFPVYVYDDSVYVDSFGGTFSPASFYDTYKFMQNGAFTMDAASAENMEAGASGGGSYRLTEEEIKAVDKMNSLISREKVEEIIASLPELSLPDDYELTLRYAARKYYVGDGEDAEESYIVNCDFEAENGYADLTLDAETGELKGFYSWKDSDVRGDDEDKPAYDVGQCRSIGEKFVEKIKNVEGYRSDRDDDYSAYYGGAHYVRYIGEIPFPADCKTAAVSANTGKVTRYYENLPKVEIVTPAAMTDRLAAVKAAYDAELVYTYMADTDANGVTTGVHPVLARRLTGKTNFYALRAEDGMPVGYDGEKAETVLPKSDETDHPAWNAFDMLRENDITLPGAYSFNDEISFGDFRNLVGMLTGIDAAPYRYIGWGPEETEEEVNGPVTREKAAETVAKQFSWDPLIDLDIYSAQYSDASGFTGGIGAAAILCGLGVMAPDENGAFRPGDKLTYGDAFIITYNLAKLNLYKSDY